MYVDEIPPEPSLFLGWWIPALSELLVGTGGARNKGVGSKTLAAYILVVKAWGGSCRTACSYNMHKVCSSLQALGVTVWIWCPLQHLDRTDSRDKRMESGALTNKQRKGEIFLVSILPDWNVQWERKPLVLFFSEENVCRRVCWLRFNKHVSCKAIAHRCGLQRIE